MKSFISFFCVLLVTSSTLAAPQFMSVPQFNGGYPQNYGINPYNNGMGRGGLYSTYPGYNLYQGGNPSGYGAGPYGVDERVNWPKLGQAILDGALAVFSRTGEGDENDRLNSPSTQPKVSNQL